MRQEWASGAHRARFEPPDMLWVSFEGPTTIEAAQWVVGVFRELSARGPFFVGIDVSRSSIGADARRVITREARPEWFLGLAYLGANLIQRTLAQAIAFALFFDRQEQLARAVAFLPDAAAARAWFASRRRVLAGAGP